MNSRTMTVTPELAKKWLRNNKGNRPLRQYLVDRYARDMLAGQWKLTHQSIAIGEDGSIPDGQHRLHAIIKANIPVVMLVTFDVPADGAVAMDSGQNRSASDASRYLGMKGVTSRSAAAAARMRIGPDPTYGTATRLELLDFHAKHQDAIDFAMKHFPRIQRGLSQAAVLAAVARAYYHADRDRLAEFCNAVVTGLCENSKTDSAAITLRNWLMSSLTKGAKAHGYIIYQKTQRALSFFLEYQGTSKLYATNEDLYPLPEEAPSEDIKLAPVARPEPPVSGVRGSIPRYARV